MSDIDNLMQDTGAVFMLYAFKVHLNNAFLLTSFSILMVYFIDSVSLFCCCALLKGAIHDAG